ncbi:MAG: hypothetical protein FJY83_02030, partial [Candidatus Aminicenantes bacterium]|nr:hypothetical protein [Candidatus Aminicenantes bacterium]
MKKGEEFIRAEGLYPHAIPDRLQFLVAGDNGLRLKGTGALDELIIGRILSDDLERRSFGDEGNMITLGQKADELTDFRIFFKPQPPEDIDIFLDKAG